MGGDGGGREGAAQVHGAPSYRPERKLKSRAMTLALDPVGASSGRFAVFCSWQESLLQARQC